MMLQIWSIKNKKSQQCY